MKLAITGHTRGIGLALYNEANSAGYSVIGLSRSTGHDISTDDILSAIEDCDCFINNAYHPESQTSLLENVINLWKGQDKLIINISSKMSYLDTMPDPKQQQYIKDKKKQNQIMQYQSMRAYPRVCNVVLGLCDTDMSKVFKTDKKMNTKDIASFVIGLIQTNPIAIQEVVLEAPGLDWKHINAGE